MSARNGTGDGPARAAWNRRGAAILSAAMALVFAVLLVRLAMVQLFGAPALRRRAETQHLRPAWRAGDTLLEQAPRGRILDRRGRPLAISWFRHDLVADPHALRSRSTPDRDRRILTLLPAMLEEVGASRVPSTARPGGLERLLFEDRVRREDGREVVVRHRVVARGLEPQARRRLGELLRRASLQGFSFVPRLERTYPAGAAAAQVVGLFGELAREPGRPPRGRGGIEQAWNAELAGTPGRLLCEQDGRGRELVLGSFWDVPPRRGADVHLTIDAELQAIAHEALARAAPRHELVVSNAVVVSVGRGDVLAAVSHPSADPDDPGADFSDLGLRALQGLYTPGSTVKPMFVSWALQQGVIHPEERLDCGGSAGWRRFGRRTVREFSRNPDPLTPRGVLVRSSNVGAVRIAFRRLGLRGMFDALEAFDVRAEPRIRFPGIARARHTSRDRAKPGYTGPAFPQGYEMVLSPLAVARIYLVLASGGLRIEPRLVRRVVGPEGGHRAVTPSPPRVLEPGPLAYVRGALLEAVESPRGTAHRVRSARWRLMGKTGTGQVDTAARLGRGYYNAWFCGIAPATHPEVVVVVHHQLRRRSRGDPYTGGAVSGPPAKEIIERTLEYLRVPEDRLPQGERGR